MQDITLLCHGCQTDKPTSEFYRSDRYKRGFMLKCKSCFAKKYQENKLKSVHDLSNKNLYPLYYRYQVNSFLLNIYSTIAIKAGDTVILEGITYMVAKYKKRRNSDPRLCRFKDVILLFYDEVCLKEK